MLGDGNCVSVLTGHQDRVRAITVSPCGECLYSGADDNCIIKWDAASGQQLLGFRGHTDVIWALTLSQDGRTLYSGSADCTVRAWDTLSGECTHIVSEQRGWVRALAVSPTPRAAADASQQEGLDISENLFTASLSWFIEARTTHDNQVLHRIPSGVGRLDLIHTLVVSNGGRMLYAGGTGCIIRGWDTESGECAQLLKGHSDTVFSIVLAPVEDEERLWSASADNTIRAWRLLDCQCLQVIRTAGVVHSLCLGSDRCSIFTAPYHSGDIAVWSLCPRVGLIRSRSNCEDDSDFAPTEVLKGHDPAEGVHSLTFSSQSGQLFSAGGDCTIRAWQVGLPSRWTKLTHQNFPRRFRNMVRTVLMAAHSCQKSPFGTSQSKPSGTKSGLMAEPGCGSLNLLRRIHDLEPCLLDAVLQHLSASMYLTAGHRTGHC
mmetsp:Transcript_34776/g.98597  ORF Transcript_34776/g.98597 Transcript_34776/m.98597 type:complete len:431 (+) Transcript_34776:391-1683(+)